MTLRALLIEDDETIAEPLVEGLGRYGLTVGHVSTGTAGLRGPYGDIVLLDLGLPDMDGIDVCRGIRQVSDVPIIMLTARGTEADRVLGLELGADDYLAKPFSVRELIARIRAVTRRATAHSGAAQAGVTGAGVTGAGVTGAGVTGAGVTGAGVTATGAFGGVPAAIGVEAVNGHGAFPDPAPTTPAVPSAATAPMAPPLSPAAESPPRSPAPPSPWDPAPAPAPDGGPSGPRSATAGALIVDRRTRQVWVGERPVTLTPKEFDLLALLTEDPGAVYSRQQILDRVWDPHFHGPTKTLDVHVATLRRKLGDPAWIQTLRGVGLRLAVRTDASPTGAQDTAGAVGRSGTGF
jgi:DNA-binding response OmpR family regulator